MKARSGQNGLLLDASRLPGTPPGFDYAGLSEIQDFSNLRIRWLQTESGLRQQITEGVGFEYALTYSDLNDYEPYLVSTSGSRLGMLMRLNLLF